MNELLAEERDDDPLLSVLNLVDVLLVVIAAMLLAAAGRATPAQPATGASSDEARAATVEIVLRDGERPTRLRSDGSEGRGPGVKVGAAYRLPDGSLVYVPE